MAYGRRNFITYQRSGANNVAPNTRSLTSYRNKILFILVVTSFYTAFLYQRGQSFSFSFVDCRGCFSLTIELKCCGKSGFWKFYSPIAVYLSFVWRTGGASTFLGTSVTPDRATAKAAKAGMSKMIASGRRFAVATWNIAGEYQEIDFSFCFGACTHKQPAFVSHQ